MSSFPDGSNGTVRSSLLQRLLLFGQIQHAWIRKVQRIRPNGFSRFRRFSCAGFSINQIQDLLCGFIDPWAARLLERVKRIHTNCYCTKSSTKRRSNFPVVDHKMPRTLSCTLHSRCFPNIRFRNLMRGSGGIPTEPLPKNLMFLSTFIRSIGFYSAEIFCEVLVSKECKRHRGFHMVETKSKKPHFSYILRACPLSVRTVSMMCSTLRFANHS